MIIPFHKIEYFYSFSVIVFQFLVTGRFQDLGLGGATASPLTLYYFHDCWEESFVVSTKRVTQEFCSNAPCPSRTLYIPKSSSLFGLSKGKLSIAGKVFIICFTVHSEFRIRNNAFFFHLGRLMISIHCFRMMYYSINLINYAGCWKSIQRDKTRRTSNRATV